MPSDRVKDALDGIRLNIEAIGTFVEGMTVEEFSSDLRTFYAVTRALEIISEASRRLPDDFKVRYPEVRWRAIRDSGNVYRHTYDRVTAAFVWDTALKQLDGLWNVVRREMGLEGPEHVKPPESDEDGTEESSRS